ncbi:MAG TPA: hypothetical protein VNM14_26455 [Planctomycetota bacterium]|jgi:hypothetical protein|nr:hypothetical protein [Planctomycetota bacterium]
MKKSLWIVLLAGCTTASPAPESTPQKPEATLEIQAENPEWQKITEELLKGKTVAEQQKILESERHYTLALAWYNRADFEKAKIEAQLAVQAWPEHLAARKLLADVNEIIVGGPTGLRAIGDHDLRVAQVTVEQQQLEITNHILHGGRFIDAKMYASALREFENAEFKIRNMPYDVKTMNDLLPKVREMIARAKSSIRD